MSHATDPDHRNRRPGAATWVPSELDARDAAALTAIRSAASQCRGCELFADATHVVVSAGPVTARMMLVGEQPGDREDTEGRPFVGPAGKLLAEAVDRAGLQRSDMYVTNAVKHFRFERRGTRRIHVNPAVAHVDACHPWLEAEMRVVRPLVIVALGATAGRALLGRDVRVGAERGRVLDTPGPLTGDARVLLTSHPSAVIRLRGKDGFDEAFDALVADLTTAAALLAG